MRHRSGVASVQAPSCSSTLNAERAASFGTPERTGQIAFTGASWLRISRTRSRRGTPEGSHTVAAGHTGRIARGRWLAEMALRAFAEDWREQSGRQSGDL
jgi:hypothetical protein